MNVSKSKKIIRLELKFATKAEKNMAENYAIDYVFKMLKFL